jgi:guanosine-3',5'-bis(diphosphate) 3'-pyrophosphohydrolase
MPTIEDAIILATKAHRGQVDKANKPYILHPLRVMLKMDTEAEMMTAVLHDVIEDTKMSMDDLSDYPEEVREAIYRLTHDEKVEYFDYVMACKENPIARKVKMADAQDNADLTRIIDPNEKDQKRRKKYQKVIEILTLDSFNCSKKTSDLEID